MTENTDGNPETTEMADSPFEPSATRQGLVSEFCEYLMENKKWWMIPIIIMVVLFGLLFALVAINPAMVPFIYPLL